MKKDPRGRPAKVAREQRKTLVSFRMTEEEMQQIESYRDECRAAEPGRALSLSEAARILILAGLQAKRGRA